MFKRTSLVRASVVVCLGLSLVLSLAPARANLIWGGGLLVASNSIANASALAFNQFNPVVAGDSTPIPTTAANTTYAVDVINNADGSHQVVLLLRYSNGAVYAITSSDAQIAALGASSSDSVTLTDSFTFGTVNGQTVVQQTVYANGTRRNLIWGGGLLVSAFTKADGTCRNLIWGGGTLTQSNSSGGGD